MIEDATTRAKLPDCLDVALRKLAAALDRLDAAAERRATADALRANLAEELAVMQDDRARLAVELDGAIGRAKALELANDEATRRLSHASAEIRAVLAEVAGREG
ncbi:MAG: DUF4164 domain-containing protein [Beijerinckiaceae bacterium]|nr:DUF4164 domain-containing protein [Beijerinckiaceae bacterium]MCI0737033.1 DUF4164 domain-containing protein [Beijerinckiaceae bacterium]